MEIDDEARQLEALRAELSRRPRGRDPQKMSDVVNQLLARRGYLQSLAGDQLQQGWCEAVGKDSASQTRVGKLRGGVLEVFVQHSTLVQELGFCQQQLLAQLQAACGHTRIRELRFRVGHVE